MPGFRLVHELGRGAGRTYGSHVYETALEAVETAEYIMRMLEGRPARRPHAIKVEDVWTGETVSTVRLNVERDPDVCVACGAPTDPFVALPALSPPGGTPLDWDTANGAGGKPGAVPTETASSQGRVLPPSGPPGDPEGP